MRKSAYARTNVPFSSKIGYGNDAQSVENDYDKESHQFFNHPSNIPGNANSFLHGIGDPSIRFATKEEKVRFDRNTRRARVALVSCTLFLFLLAFSRPIYGPYIDRFGEDGDATLIEVVKDHLTKRAERHGLGNVGGGHSSKRNANNRHNNNNGNNKEESTFHARYRRIEEERRALLEEHKDGVEDEMDTVRRLEVLEERAKNLLREHGKKHGRKRTHESNSKGMSGGGGGAE
tara:strand:- start:1078 stop:1776 length:699 start_codon:yes stop_codon:yes gene_type:complete